MPVGHSRQNPLHLFHFVGCGGDHHGCSLPSHSVHHGSVSLVRTRSSSDDSHCKWDEHTHVADCAVRNSIT